MERLAVADLGSNSWRLVVYGYEPGTHWWSLVDEIREAVRVGAGMGETGAIQPERVDRALHTAAVFASFCKASGIDQVVAVATSAIRDAANGPDLLAAIREHTGLEPRVISGREEAGYGHLAVVNSTTIADGFGLDIGGGSIQALRIEGRALADATSLPLGSVRVSERFLPGESAGAKQMSKLRKVVRTEIEALDWWQGGGRLVGLGGTIRNLATAAMKRLDLPSLDVQGFVLEREALTELIELLAATPTSKRGTVSGVKPDRGDVILGGAVVLDAVLDAGGFHGIEVTEAGLREGVLFEHLLGDPPLLEHVREASVQNLAHRFDHDPRHATHVAALSLQMFDGLAAAGLHQMDGTDRELLWAACMLHDIGTAIDYDDHHRHSHYLILNAGLPGFSPRELVLVGLVARYHRKGEPSVAGMGDLAEDGDEQRLAVLCGIIRLAEQFERSHDGAVRCVEVTVRDGTVALRTRTDRKGDPTVPVWAARRNASLLAGAIGCAVEVG